MAILFDTNILLYLVRSSTTRQKINPTNQEEYISVVTLGEIQSLAVQNKWGNSKAQKLEDVLLKFVILDINHENIIDRYVQIDTFSQRKHSSITPAFKTPKNMGKNDLWIAATASFLELPLITTDKDFDHLHDVFVNVKYIDPESFMKNK